MNKNELTLDSIITKGKFKNKTVRELIDENKKNMLTLCQDGYNVNDEVCEYAGYKRTIRKTETEMLFRDKPKAEKKIYPKDTENIKKILNELATLEHIDDFVEEDSITINIEDEDE